MNIKLYKGLVAGLCTFLAIGFQPAQAVLVSAGDFNDNDCAGYFGIPFGACTIFVPDNGGVIELSPVIAKYDMNEAGDTIVKTEVNTALYPTVDGTEFSFTPGPSGTWTYTQGTDDPGVRYWVAKAANDFTLFWDVDAADIESPCSSTATDQTNYNLACLQAANLVTTGYWETAGGKGLSHLTFYDTEPVSTSNGGGEEEVPEPGVLALLGIGLLGGLVARRRFTKQG